MSKKKVYEVHLWILGVCNTKTIVAEDRQEAIRKAVRLRDSVSDVEDVYVGLLKVGDYVGD